MAGVIGTGTTSVRAQGEIFKDVAEAGTYCHIKFPAIREDTLSEASPDLTISGDVIDYYGPCDHDWAKTKFSPRDCRHSIDLILNLQTK